MVLRELDDRVFSIELARHIARDVSFHPEEGFKHYAKGHYPICIDDLGHEDPITTFGQTRDVIEEILLDRHHYKQITHATTNKDPELLKVRYGNRVYDRLKEMFNIIPFDYSGTSMRF